MHLFWFNFIFIVISLKIRKNKRYFYTLLTQSVIFIAYLIKSTKETVILSHTDTFFQCFASENESKFGE